MFSSRAKTADAKPLLLTQSKTDDVKRSQKYNEEMKEWQQCLAMLGDAKAGEDATIMPEDQNMEKDGEDQEINTALDINWGESIILYTSIPPLFLEHPTKVHCCSQRVHPTSCGLQSGPDAAAAVSAVIPPSVDFKSATCLEVAASRHCGSCFLLGFPHLHPDILWTFA
eukprot:Gb_19018 [translate_table: standard]